MINNEILILTEKHTDTFIERTKTKPQATLEIKVTQPRETFSNNLQKSFLMKENGW